MKKIGLVGMSNGQQRENKPNVLNLIKTINECGYEVALGDYIYETENYFSGSPQDKAKDLMKMYDDDDISQIFDISGGDVANEVLEYLDYQVIANSDKIFYGYSDVTTVINAIYAKTGKASGLYQIRNLIYENSQSQIQAFKDNFSYQNEKLEYSFIQEGYMKGVVIGGNIRCFLKLAGTEYMPDFTDKILLLEGLNTTSMQCATYLAQLRQMGAFKKINGILLGTFTRLDKEIFVPSVEELVYKYAGADIAVARTHQIGHGSDSRCIYIGNELELIDN